MILCWKLIAVTLFLLSFDIQMIREVICIFGGFVEYSFFFCWFQGDFADVLFVSLVEGFLEWINQYWKECPWSSAGNCFTLFSSLFSIFLPALHISYKGGFCFFWL
jgi:hypothetical protein